ncbi:lipoprotein LipL31 [Leptospira sp. GIMC2001]|uniref:lipoprotein LipL31 n=1 Tax=Leptospira sp. GIMC2001 TaxID=1513297 RepID=UPI0023494468|nr:lipoprotein LipL31 [Leptospira sp. GIMC2001]WCL48060.1 lipoprotein LipL31 [Leptospira sp. GIMC2001]
MKKLIISSLLFLSFLNCGDNSELIESLNGEKITVKRFESSYEAAIETMSRMQNIEKKNLLEFISKDIDEVPEQFQALNYQFQKKNFYDNYRQMLMTKLAAEKSGFTSRQDIKEILEQVQMQTITQLYIQEQVEKRIKITEDEAKAECARLRGQNAQLAAMPIDKCVMLGRGTIKRNKSQEVLPKVMERIKEGVSIKHNEKFDLDAYLASESLPGMDKVDSKEESSDSKDSDSKEEPKP